MSALHVSALSGRSSTLLSHRRTFLDHYATMGNFRNFNVSKELENLLGNAGRGISRPGSSPSSRVGEARSIPPPCDARESSVFHFGASSRSRCIRIADARHGGGGRRYPRVGSAPPPSRGSRGRRGLPRSGAWRRWRRNAGVWAVSCGAWAAALAGRRARRRCPLKPVVPKVVGTPMGRIPWWFGTVAAPDCESWQSRA